MTSKADSHDERALRVKDTLLHGPLKAAQMAHHRSLARYVNEAIKSHFIKALSDQYTQGGC